MGPGERKLKATWQAILGLLLVLTYWIAVRPPSLGRLGYADDLGGLEISRQIMADNLRAGGVPSFHTTRMLAPQGGSAAFFSWSIERDGLGAYAWMANPDFPWLWVYFGISLLICYFGVGYISRRMGMAKSAAWGLAAAITLFHVPRHFKTYVHYEHITRHWSYVAIFLDAWIWQRVWREKKWSIHLEAWRGLVVLLTLGLGGYFWGALLVEWTIVRGSVVGLWLIRKRKESPIQIEFFPRKIILPLVLCVGVFVIDLLWFLPLLREAMTLGTVWQGSGWTANPALILRPIWTDGLGALLGAKAAFESIRLSPINVTETVISPGWFWVLPAFAGIWFTRKKSGGPGVGAVLPFVGFFLFLILYIRGVFLGTPIQNWFPFLKFFRVSVRMGLFLPELLAAMIALSWPELSRVFLAPRARPWLIAFAISSLLEFPILATLHVEVLPPIDPSLERILKRIHDQPGTAVLDMPFAVHGGNFSCSYSLTTGDVTAPLAFTGTHDKSVYGIYVARLVASQCEPYNHPPYLSWFSAWKTQRCLQGQEWTDFCAYLDQHSETSAVLVYPDIWKAIDQPMCRAELDAHLGAPIDEGRFVIKTVRDLNPELYQYTRVFQYGPRCVTK